MKIYTVSTLFRAHSSGSGEPYVKSFSNLENASKYLIEQFNGYLLDYNYPEEWELNDMFTDEEMKDNAPAPTKELGKTLFSVEALEMFLNDKKRYHNIIYGPYSEYEFQIPFEIQFYESTLD
jgi:hypothetical protein